MDKYEVLQRCFGYERFRDGQEELIDGVLSRRDVFGIMPTGGGKSICYQVPALLLSGVTLVISPLISLMRDQVMALKTMGVPAAYINSTLSGGQMQAVYRNLRSGMYKIVYVAPERLDYGGFSDLVSQLDISFIAVDEAHCISQWGQDFRPSYLRIVQFIDSLPVRPVVGAFTATATEQVRQDVERILGLRDAVQVVTGFDRPNLRFEVQKPKEKNAALLSLLSSRREKSGIVYCATRKKVEEVCELLCDNGYSATRYHAGLGEKERTLNQEDFLYDRKSVMVATNAFGMGIDKSNVSYVIHYNMPKSVESYYQEAGRAGRDGADADCILLYSAGDVMTARFLIDNSSDNEELDAVQKEEIRRQDLKRLDSMVAYCKTKECLRGYLLDYFGQKHELVCGNCGNCVGAYEEVDITRQAQMIISCVYRIREKIGYYVGATTVAKVLRGSKDKKLLELRLDQISTYGLMKNTGITEIRDIMDQLEVQGYLLTEPTHQTVQVAASAGAVLFHGEKVTMKRPLVVEQPKIKVSAGKTDGLFEQLRSLRTGIAMEAGIPAFMVFSNATLTDMARRKPVTMDQMLRVSGVGQVKAERYGRRFLEVICSWVEEQG